MSQEDVLSSREESKKAISQISISGMLLALALIMEWISKLIPFFSWPMGGSVSLTMVPLILIGLYCGPVYGTVVSILFGGINFLMDGVISWTPNVTAVLLSLLLDYVIGFGACGLSSLFRKPFFEKKAYAIIFSVVLCGFVRFLSSFFSGMIVFTQAFDYEATSGLSPAFTWGGFVYSLVYNGGYMLPSVILDVICLFLLAKPLYSISKLPVVHPLLPVANSTDGQTKSTLFDFSFEKMFPFYALVGIIIGIVSSIPALKISYFGYFGLILGLALLVYIIVKACKQKKLDNIHVIYLAFALCILAINLCGNLSAFTYGASFYKAD